MLIMLRRVYKRYGTKIKSLKVKFHTLTIKKQRGGVENESADPIIIPYNETKVKLHLNDTLISKHPLEGFYKTSVYKLAIININEYDELLWLT